MRTEEPEERQIEEIGSGGGELKEVPVNSIPTQHAQGIYPEKSLISTKKERNIGEGEQVQIQVQRSRNKQQRLNPLSPVEAMELLTDKLAKTRNNQEFLHNMSSI